ncbi:MAG: DUF4241 domain-containing protein [Lachnospiraceae bacterium]|nr:DUF4241 domain-containing protein [Lachnospiraceae bacterium]
MTPQKEWLALYEQKKQNTASQTDFNTYFELPEIAGKMLTVMDIGACELPSGKLLVRDPLVYLGSRGEQPYFQTAPAGTYRVEVCVVKPEESGGCARYAAVRLRFSEKRAVRFYEALIGNEDLNELHEDEYFGFNVDAGLGCICDAAVHSLFCDWSEKWDREHPGGNQYDDYFAALFAESFRTRPEFQRSGGDWINWKLPGTEYHIPMFQSGFGDGAYPVYWGYDEAGGICQLVIQFIDIALAYGQAEGD